MKVRVFGVKDRSTPGTERGGGIEYSSHRFTLLDLMPTLDFGDADLIVLPASAQLGGNSREHETGTKLLVNRILGASQCAGLVCLVYAEDFSSPQCPGSELLRRWGLRIQEGRESLARIHAVEFDAYLREYGVQGFVFDIDSRLGVRHYRLAGPADETAKASAFVVVTEGNRLIYLVPANLVPGSELALLSALADAVAAHAPAILRPATAPIADSFVFTEEAKLRESRQVKQAELEDLDASLSDYNSRKDILFLRDDPLANRLPEWLEKYFGIRTRRTEEYIEDFWLLDSEGAQAAICEAKGLDKNVKRQHITALELHREERELADDYPSVLVVNTFADADTEQDKTRQHVGQRERRHAVKKHVLIVRTLDLARLLDQIDRKVVSTQEVRQLFTSETGWLKVEGDSREIVKQ